MAVADKALFRKCLITMRPKTTKNDLPSTHNVSVYIHNRFADKLKLLKKEIKVSRMSIISKTPSITHRFWQEVPSKVSVMSDGWTADNIRVSRRISLSPFPTLRYHSGTLSGPSITFQAFPSPSIKFLPFQSTPFLTPPIPSTLPSFTTVSGITVPLCYSPFLSVSRFYSSPSLPISRLPVSIRFPSPRLYPFLTASARPVSWTVSCLTSYQTSHYRQMLLSYHAVLLRDLSVYKAVRYGS